MTRSILVLLTVCFAVRNAHAAPKPPVHWSVKAAPASVKAGGRFQVVLQGAIEPGWHLYALQEPEGGPVATEVALAEGDPADLLRVEQLQPTIVPDPVFQVPTAYFAGITAFTLKLQTDRSAVAGPQTLHVLVRYQSCNDRMCLPPHTDTIEVPLKVTR